MYRMILSELNIVFIVVSFTLFARVEGFGLSTRNSVSATSNFRSFSIPSLNVLPFTQVISGECICLHLRILQNKNLSNLCLIPF